MFAASAFVGAPVVSARVVSAPRATRAPRTVALFGFGEKKEEPKKKTFFGTISGSKSGTKVTTRSGTKSGTKVVTKSSAKKVREHAALDAKVVSFFEGLIYMCAL